MTDRHPHQRILPIIVVLTLAAGACHGGGSSGAGGAPGTVMTAASQASTMAAAPAMPTMPPGVTAAMITLGDSLFHANACARCHGKAGVGAQNGPPLVKSVASPWLHSTGTYDEIVATILAGVPKAQLKDPTRPYQMNPRGSNPPLNDDQVRAAAAYIWKLNHP